MAYYSHSIFTSKMLCMNFPNCCICTCSHFLLDNNSYLFLKQLTLCAFLTGSRTILLNTQLTMLVLYLYMYIQLHLKLLTKLHEWSFKSLEVLGQMFTLSLLLSSM